MLQKEGLRFARPNEDGWVWEFVDPEGERITWLVTWA